MLLPVPGKVLNRVILDRVKDAVDPQLRDQQAGFRRNRSCADQIASLRIIIEQSLEWNSPLYINFIDYEKAFDSVDRQTLWKLLRHYGVPVKIVSLIQCIYQDMGCRVVHAGQTSEKFQVKTGVRQGCLLSPFLFLLVIDWIMRETTRGKNNGIQWTLFEQLDDLDFADDLALLAHNQNQMQDKPRRLETFYAKTGLKINLRKTEFQVKTGVRQGCLLSPFLFLLVIDWIMRETTRGKNNGIQWTLFEQLDDLDFADDLALLAHNQNQMQDKTRRLEAFYAKTGLKINLRKTELIKIDTTANTPITVGGKPIKEVESFVYLGSTITKQGGTDEDVTSRIGKARGAFIMLKKVWTSKEVSTETKMRIFNSKVSFILWL